MKICFTSSSGGHFNQMYKISLEYDDYDKVFITEETNYSKKVLEDKNKYFFKIINRKEKSFYIKFIANIIKSYKILRVEKPELIISTGSLITVPVCFVGKIMGAKVIFIESFAKVSTPTLSGKIVSKFADKVIVQWEEMMDCYENRNVEYGGTIY